MRFNPRIKDQSIENLLDVTRAQVFLRNRAPFHLLLASPSLVGSPCARV